MGLFPHPVCIFYAIVLFLYPQSKQCAEGPIINYLCFLKDAGSNPVHVQSILSVLMCGLAAAESPP